MRLADEQAQDPVTSRQASDLLMLLWREPAGHEKPELFSRLVDDTEGRIPGADHVARGVGDLLEDPIEGMFGVNSQGHVGQPLHPRPDSTRLFGGTHGIQAIWPYI